MSQTRPTHSDSESDQHRQEPPVSSASQLSQTLGASFSGISRGTQKLDLTNCVLGDFRLLRRLGSGGMAQVYLAEQTSLQRNVAIKVMRPDFGGDDLYRQRFEHEARAAAGLTHPNIVQVYGVGEEDGIHYIAQEYVHGLNLRQFLDRRKPPGAHLAIHLMRQVSSALNAAHKSGIVHRDIKPENIMVTRKMTAKVADFGLAQLTLGGERVNLTQQGVTMGTPLYMSPEQVNGANVDPRSDLYSLGVTFYHLLTGRPPFTAPTAFALAYKHLNENATPLEHLRPDLPPALIRVIHRLMAKQASDRFPDAKSLNVELKRIQESGEIEGSWAEEVEELEATNRPRLFHVSRERLKAYGITCLILISMASGAGRERRRRSPFDAPIDRAASTITIGQSPEEQLEVARSLAAGPSPRERQEEAWRAVIDNFPTATQAILEARRELALLFVASHLLLNALTLKMHVTVLSWAHAVNHWYLTLKKSAPLRITKVDTQYWQ